MSKELELSAKLLKHQLGSVDLSDIEKLRAEKLNGKDSMSRAVEVELFYKSVFKKVIKLLIQEQLEFMGKEVGDTYQFQFARGTVNGLFLVRDWFDDEEREALSRHAPKVVSKPTSDPFPDISF